MSTQKDAYEGDTRIKSEPTGLLSRANRCHYRKQQRIIDATVAESGDAVLEVGSGHGIHTKKYGERFNLTAIDLSESLVEETRARAADSNCIVADARNLPFSDDRFRAVVGTAIAHHLPDLMASLTEWSRVVESGGSITIAEPNYLFPKDFATAHLIAEERHKTQMAPWRVRDVLEEFPCKRWTLEPFNYTPPLPSRAIPLYERIDSIAERVPIARWAGMMLLIHVEI